VLERPPGEELRAAVKNAAVSLALWSPRSAAQTALVAEVAALPAKAPIIHVNMQSEPSPAQFSGQQAVNLTGWRGEDEFPAWRELAKHVTKIAGLPPLPPPAARAPSGFFQPGRLGAADAAAAPRQQPQQRPQPQPRRAMPEQPPPPAATNAKPTKGGPGLMLAIIAIIVLAIAGGGGFYLFNQTQTAKTAAAAWVAVDNNDAAALRAFIAGSSGAARTEAEAALQELEVRSYEAASDSDTIEALQSFLEEFPDSEHAIAARGRIAELQTLPPTVAETVPLMPPENLDPDLVPPGTTPDASGGPAQLTPPTDVPAP
jgi:hypothetical protein